jgi:AAA family ATP:ADP antiporter
MHGYEAAYQAEKKRPSSEESLLEKVRNGISGLLVIIKNPYVAGISGLVFIYEIIIVIFDYRVLIFADKTYTSVEALSSYYALYYLCMHGIGLIISLLGTIPLQRLLGLTTSLFICPTVAGILIVGTHFYPTATSLFIALVLLRSFNYALNHPTREALYIPTTKTIKFKAKAWTDAFGSRAAKATGSAFNKASKALVASEALFLSTAASLGLVGIWFAITNYLANRFKKAVENKELIGEEHEASDEEREDLA